MSVHKGDGSRELFTALLAGLPDGYVEDVRVGAFWTAAVVKTNGGFRCGLAASLRPEMHLPAGGPDVRDAGKLSGGSARNLAALVHSQRVMERSIGLAALNALLPRLEDQWTAGNAEEILARLGAGRCVAVVGHFPFVERLRERVGRLWVLELQPRGDDLPAEAAPDIIAQADLIAITGTTLLNNTFGGLMALRRSDAHVMVLGPSTPLSPVMFEHGVDMVSGAAVNTSMVDIESVLAAVSQGGGFRQVRRPGVRLVTMYKREGG